MSNSSGNDFQYYRYDPSISAAGVFAVLFFIFSLLHLYQLLRTKTWIFIPFVIGGFMEAIGYIGVCRHNDTELAFTDNCPAHP